jgi:NAD(P)-dependent dehydrogenase (short-subunit alcohol dehydrogenase family)
VNAFVDDVAARTGRIDVLFNAIGYGDVQQPLMEIAVGDFLQPIATAMRSQFLTTRAAARHMTARGSGVPRPSRTLATSPLSSPPTWPARSRRGT